MVSNFFAKAVDFAEETCKSLNPVGAKPKSLYCAIPGANVPGAAAASLFHAIPGGFFQEKPKKEVKLKPISSSAVSTRIVDEPILVAQ